MAWSVAGFVAGAATVMALGRYLSRVPRYQDWPAQVSPLEAIRMRDRIRNALAAIGAVLLALL